MQKWRSLRESQSAMEIQQQELALAQKKMEEKSRMESLRLEEEAAVAVAKAQAIDKELSLEDHQDPEHFDLPQDDLAERVQNYINSQRFEESNTAQDSRPPVPNHVIDPQHPQNTNHLIREKPPNRRLDPTTNSRTDPSTNVISSYIQFMARKELIANKIQRFDDNPRNFYGWKESFKNMIRDIHLTPSEELSLIIEYTSNESKKLAQRLRNAYINKPTEGVEILWQKLSQRFGSNVVITNI